jgi:hypothetical protein
VWISFASVWHMLFPIWKFQRIEPFDFRAALAPRHAAKAGAGGTETPIGKQGKMLRKGRGLRHEQDGLGPTAIARRLGIGRASVYRALGAT